jgi:secondary thiamine-phosphate synthase enzyme
MTTGGGCIMRWLKEDIQLETQGKGLYPITALVTAVLKEWEVQDGMCFLFIPHTSASLTINESYDPTAKQDLEVFFEKQVPEGESWYRHTAEGSDDSTSHIRTTLTQTSVSIPVDEGDLSLGTWQGIYLFEHRSRSKTRKLKIRCLST